MKTKLLFSVLLLSIIIYSCKSDDDGGNNFDHAAQALTDDETIREYLSTHFYTSPSSEEDFGVIDTITSGEVSMLADASIKTVSFNDIDYKLYYIKNALDGVGTSPSRIDSVLVKYQGLLIDYSEEPKFDERVSYTWLLLSSTIPGWSYGFPNFKSGVNVSLPDLPLDYEDTGKGVLIIPSGLAYQNIGTVGISPNVPILFHIDLGQVVEADHDLDTIASNYENLNGDDDYTNDDTDEDGSPNFVDFDDEGDRVLTRYENPDPNGDSNPNDALDTDGDNIPNYLDKDDDGDGIDTIFEDADENGDGNPDDAKDTDGDNIPDYLDSDS